MNKTIHQPLKTGLAILGITSACVAGQAQTGILYTTHLSNNVSKTCGYQNGQNVLQYKWLSAAEVPVYVDAVDQEIRQAN